MTDPGPATPHWSADEDRLARVALSFLAEPKHSTVCAELAGSGAVATLASIRRGRLSTQEDLTVRLGGLDLRALVAAVDRSGARVVVPDDDDWPSALDRLAEPPYCLYVRGAADLAQVADRAVAVVGSRAATEYGEAVARDLAEGLAARGWAVVSGMAYGVDVAAHRGALASEGVTVAVLACGVDRAYPSAHRRVIEAVAETGAVVSEVPPGAVPFPSRFIARNRIIAALGRATVVVEASLRSGSRSTASEALRLHRPVGAVPGPVTSMMSAGCHALVRSGSAVVVTDVAEVLELAAPIGEGLLDPRVGASRDTDVLGPAERAVLAALPLRGAAVPAAVAVAAGVSEPAVRSALGVLDALGFVVRAGEGWRAAGAAGARNPGAPTLAPRR